MWHGLISPYLNLGLLQPIEVIDAISRGLLRSPITPQQCRRIYQTNIRLARIYARSVSPILMLITVKIIGFGAQSRLPEFFWDSSQFEPNCLQQTLKQTEETAYAHHIQRLVVSWLILP